MDMLEVKLKAEKPDGKWQKAVLEIESHDGWTLDWVYTGHGCVPVVGDLRNKNGVPIGVRICLRRPAEMAHPTLDVE